MVWNLSEEAYDYSKFDDQVRPYSCGQCTAHTFICCLPVSKSTLLPCPWPLPTKKHITPHPPSMTK